MKGVKFKFFKTSADLENWQETNDVTIVGIPMCIPLQSEMRVRSGSELTTHTYQVFVSYFEAEKEDKSE